MKKIKAIQTEYKGTSSGQDLRPAGQYSSIFVVLITSMNLKDMTLEMD